MFDLLIFRKAKYNPLAFINLLRIIGALCIGLLFHNYFIPNIVVDVPVLGFIHNNGRVFVEMFFIISGMMFYLAYYKKIISKEITIGRFFAKKAIYLYPLVIFTTLYVYIMNLTMHNLYNVMYAYGSLDIFQLFLGMFFGGPILYSQQISNNAPVWYLTVLFLCYLVAWLLTFLCKKTKNKAWFAIPILIGLGAYISNVNIPFFNKFISRGYMFFFLGIFIMMFLNNFKDFKVKIKITIRLVLGLYLICILVLLCLPNIRNQIFSDYILIAGFMIFPAIIILSYDVIWLNNLLSNKATSYLGKISLDVFLFNYPIHVTLLMIGCNVTFDFTTMKLWFVVMDLAIHSVITPIVHYFIDNKLCKKLDNAILGKINNNEKQAV